MFLIVKVWGAGAAPILALKARLAVDTAIVGAAPAVPVSVTGTLPRAGSLLPIVGVAV